MNVLKTCPLESPRLPTYSQLPINTPPNRSQHGIKIKREMSWKNEK